ncbi:cohesin domain-containing protein [Clostridium sp.]|uniref:cohesin domain-containing protein n=1 Tax=Clostridium sp. TaxID=1506 RepID=UPI001A4DF3B1|nr:cohesin domain-containing protein [Clostridium sp.]MBK5240657.1 hypothetical protein [Clostridium sp.]
MKKIIACFLCCILFIYGGTAKAEGTASLTVNVKGKMEIGQTIQILINIENIDSLYAAAASLKYDPKVLNIISFEKGDLITKDGTNTFDVENKIDNINGIASFGGFSCLGEINGFSGSGTLLKINVEVLKKDSFHIKSKPFLASPNDIDNLKIQLCDKNIKELTYGFIGYEFNVSSNSRVEEVEEERTKVQPYTNSTAKTSTDSIVIKESEKEQESTVVNPNSNTKASTDSLNNNENEIEQEQEASTGLSNSNMADDKDIVMANKSEIVFSVKNENLNKTGKSQRWQKGALTSVVIIIVFAVLGGIYFLRNKNKRKS